jgi:hypothetical protein
MEALSALEDELKRRSSFANEPDLQISQLRRDQNSPYAKSMISNFEQSRIDNKNYLNNFQDRLFQALENVTKTAEMIELKPDMLQSSLEIPFIEKEPTDNLILHCLLAHARLHPNEVKVLLSGNRNDFAKGEVQEALRNAEVSKYFTRAQDFLGWLNSQATL